MQKSLIFLLAAFIIIVAAFLVAFRVLQNEQLITKSNNDGLWLSDSILIQLPAPSFKGTMSVEEALYKRRSYRNYSGETLSLANVSQLLWSAYGVTKTVQGSGRMYKTAPSAGALYPLEVYLLAGNVESIKAGLYKYLPATHKISLKMTGDMREDTKNACLGQKMIADAPASIVFTAVYERTTTKYGKRGKERYVCMDLGHAAQNVYLQATTLGLGTCAVGAFDDHLLHKLFQLPSEEEVLYLMPIGKIKSN